jgi:CubicO group peptidase (beta-lactamase class C family)
VSFAAGAIYTTTGDLLKWHNGLLNNTVVQRSSLDRAFTDYKNNYGYGWGIATVDGKKKVSHGGGIFGFNAHLARIEQDDLCVVLLNNVGNPKLSEISQKAFDIVYDKPYKLPEVKKEMVVSEEILKKYVGTYEIVPQFQIVISVEKGQLVAQATGQPKFDLFAQKDNYFFVKAVEAEVEFLSDDKGAVTQLLLYQGGRKTPAKKIN